MRTVKHILFGFLMVMLFAPMLQHLTNLIPEKELQGSFVLLQKPLPIKDSIISGIYMSRMNDYVEQNIGLRPTLVRINNQLDYSLYSLPHSHGVIIGKDGQLFEEDYITEYLGRNFIGEKTIAKKVARLKFLQDYLKKEKNIDLIVVLSPSKVRYYPEDIPDRFEPSRKSLTNYQCFIDNFNSSGLKYINFSSWFESMKKDAKYPLFPQTGIHWSDYGSLLAFDSIIRYIEVERKIDLPEMVTSTIEMSDKARSSDDDLWRVMNLSCYISHPSLAYPVLRIEDHPRKIRPRLLTISDSFYWNWSNNAVPERVFRNPAFWLYNRQVFTSDIKGTKFIDQLNLKEEVEKRDVIILMVTERFLYAAFWNFSEDLYKVYNSNPTAEDIILDYGGQIRRNKDWFMSEIKKAAKMHLSLEAMVDLDAAYVYGEEFKKKTNNTRKDSLLLDEVQIWSDSSKLAEVSKQTNTNGLSLNEMVSRWVADQYNHKHNGQSTISPSEIEAKIKQIEIQIRSDKDWLNLVKTKAKERKISLDEMIHIDAKWTYEQYNK
jgi:hypothetical protein